LPTIIAGEMSSKEYRRIAAANLLIISHIVKKRAEPDAMVQS
jgi:hypothetical protein